MRMLRALGDINDIQDPMMHSRAMSCLKDLLSYLQQVIKHITCTMLMYILYMYSGTFILWTPLGLTQVTVLIVEVFLIQG